MFTMHKKAADMLQIKLCCECVETRPNIHLQSNNICNTLASERYTPDVSHSYSWYVTEIWHKQCKNYTPPTKQKKGQSNNRLLHVHQ